MTQPILDENLRRLFERAYRPVQPREGFRLALQRRAESRNAGLRASDGEPDRTESPLSTPSALHHWTSAPAWRIAAGLLLAIGFGLAVFRLVAPSSPSDSSSSTSLATREGVLATGRAAVTFDGRDWRAVRELELERGLEARGAFQLVTVARAVPVRFPAESSAAPVEAWSASVLPSSEVRLAGSPADGFELNLVAGALELQGPGTGAARRAGRLVTAAGRLALTPDVALAMAEGGLALGLEPPPDGRCFGLRVDAGAITDEAGTTLRTGQSAYLCEGLLLPSRTVAVVVPSGTERRPLSKSPQAASPGEVDAGTAQASEGDPLAGRARLHLRVRDAAGAPVEDLRIALLEEVVLPRTSDPEFFEVEADGGQWTSPELSPASYRVQVWSSGRAPFAQAGVLLAAGETRTLEVSLAEECHLRGAVVEARTGQPVAGALVLSEHLMPSFVLPLFAPVYSPEHGVPTARTDADGVFRLSGLGPGTHLLRVSHPEHGVSWREVRIARSEEVLPTVIELTSGGTLQGHVTDSAGLPAPGVGVITCALEWGSRRPCMSCALGASDEAGRYRLEHLPTGPQVVLFFEDDSYMGQPEVQYVTVRADAPTELDHRAPSSDPSRTLRGRILEPDGEPAGGVSILLLTPGTTPGPTEWESQLTNADGEFVFRDLDPGDYQVHLSRAIRDESTLHATVRIAPESGEPEPLELRFSRAGVRGRVLDASSGEGIDGVQLVLRRETPSGDFAYHGRARSDATGSFEVLGLLPGRYRWMAVPPAGFAATFQDLDVLTGQVLDIELPLVEGGSIALRVLDSSGHAVGNAGVHLHGVGSDADSTWISTTAADGRTTLTGLELGPCSLSIRHEGFERLDLELHILPGESERTVRLNPRDEREIPR